MDFVWDLYSEQVFLRVFGGDVKEWWCKEFSQQAKTRISQVPLWCYRQGVGGSATRQGVGGVPDRKPLVSVCVYGWFVLRVSLVLYLVRSCNVPITPRLPSGATVPSVIGHLYRIVTALAPPLYTQKKSLFDFFKGMKQISTS